MASSNSNRYKMSQERLEELKKELNYMETVREKEVSEQIKEARNRAGKTLLQDCGVQGPD